MSKTKIRVLSGGFNQESSSFIGTIEAEGEEFKNLKQGDELEVVV